MSRYRLAIPALLAALAFAGPATAAPDGAWRAVPVTVPGDSLAAVLHALEARGTLGVRPGEAAWALGQFHYARGEYQQAAGDFQRASARLDGDDRAEARYAFALANLALGTPAAARPVLEDLVRHDGPVRARALLALAQCWDAEHHPEKSQAVLARLLAGNPGEAGPAALERYADLCTAAHRDADAQMAWRRLQRDYPRSVEAARRRAAAR